MSITEQIKVKGKSWHDQVESKSPIAALFRAPFSESLEIKLDEFKGGIKPLWQEVIAHSGSDEMAMSLRNSFAEIYDVVPEGEEMPDLLRSYALKYVLLGSSMGSAFIYKTLRDKGYKNLRYFECTKNLAPEFIKLKKVMDAEITEDQLPIMIEHIGHAYGMIKF